jgi:hypothetical protein
MGGFSSLKGGGKINKAAPVTYLIHKVFLPRREPSLQEKGVELAVRGQNVLGEHERRSKGIRMMQWMERHAI